MLQFSKKTDYGLIFLLNLAKNYGHNLQPLSEIAKTNGLPKSFLAKLAATLKKAKIVSSKEGVNGGYMLARPPEKITLQNLFAVLESKTKSYCARTSEASCGCQFCTTRDVIDPIEAEIEKTLANKTLADLISKQDVERLTTKA